MWSSPTFGLVLSGVLLAGAAAALLLPPRQRSGGRLALGFVALSTSVASVALGRLRHPLAPIVTAAAFVLLAVHLVIAWRAGRPRRGDVPRSG